MNAKIVHRMIKYSRNLGIGCLAVAVLSYAIDFQTRGCTEQIYSQIQLEKIVEEEKHKIGISPTIAITSTLEDLEKEMSKIPAYGERKNKEYFIHFDDTTGNSRGVVRHELCHVYYEDFPRRLSSWKEWLPYLLIEEPRAVWCSLEF